MTEPATAAIRPVPPPEVPEPEPISQLDDPRLYFNRELSWLQFNERVLELAEDTSVALLERFKFAAIYASNLDEFMQIRVAGPARPGGRRA